jgi:hypothetical protein
MASLLDLVRLNNQGAIRNRPITPFLHQNIAEAVNTVYGPGYRAEVFSGGQEGPRRTGSVRHNNGRAADIYVYGPDGKRLSGDALAPLGQYWAAKKTGGVGMEMHGGGIHLDEWAKPPPGGGMFWNYAKKGGNYTPAMAKALDAGSRGELPPLLSMANSNTPQPRGATAQIAQAVPNNQQPAPIMQTARPSRTTPSFFSRFTAPRKLGNFGDALSMLALSSTPQQQPMPMMQQLTPQPGASLADFMKNYI